MATRLTSPPGSCRRPAPTASLAFRRAWSTEHVWPAARRFALARDGYTCTDCGVTDWDARLEVHHRTPVVDYSPGCAHHSAGLVTLCEACHRQTHLWLRAPVGSQLALAIAS